MRVDFRRGLAADTSPFYKVDAGGMKGKELCFPFQYAQNVNVLYSHCLVCLFMAYSSSLPHVCKLELLIARSIGSRVTGGLI